LPSVLAARTFPLRPKTQGKCPKNPFVYLLEHPFLAARNTLYRSLVRGGKHGGAIFLLTKEPLGGTIGHDL